MAEMHVRAKTQHHMSTDGLQGPREDLELRKPQGMSSRHPQKHWNRARVEGKVWAHLTLIQQERKQH